MIVKLQMQDRYVEIGPVNTRYWVSGEKGPTVLLIHGLGGSLENWKGNIEALAENHRVYALDLVGFGYSDKPQMRYTFAALARFVNDFMAARQIDRASLVGLSLGGAVSLQFVHQFPHKVEKLVLVDSAGLGYGLPLPLRLATLPLLGELLFWPIRRGTINFLKSSIHDPALITVELIDFTHRLAGLPGARQAFLSLVRNQGTFWGPRRETAQSLNDELGHINVPTLIVWGQQDRVVPVAHAYGAQRSIPNARLHIFDPCGHLPQLERPDEFNALLLDFLAE